MSHHLNFVRQYTRNITKNIVLSITNVPFSLQASFKIYSHLRYLESYTRDASCKVFIIVAQLQPIWNVSANLINLPNMAFYENPLSRFRVITCGQSD
jgi:hypothetical protein